MPYVALAPADREARFAGATTRWDAILAARPELQPAVTLQHDLLGLVADLAETLGRGRMPRLSLPPKYLAAKLLRGVPALCGEPIPVPVALLSPALGLICDALGRGGAGQAANHIRTQLDETRMDAGSLLTASLKRDQSAIRSGAEHRGLSPDLLWLVAELAVSPFAHLLEQALFAPAGAGSPLRGALDAWSHGYCPLCTSWPALAEVSAAHRVLRCSFCSLAWELNGRACVYCGDAGETFAASTPNQERKDRRLETCGACGGYLKTVDVQAFSPFPLLAISDLETMDLDVAAMERGFRRPPLKELGHSQ
jgi:FdhE protein